MFPSTRLILLHAEAGQVIYSFGHFVVGGNPVVGFIIFIILIVIQFIVHYQRGGAGIGSRCSFTLDAMPGKQMAIDADFKTLVLSMKMTASASVGPKIQEEADFYGAMDGASKFVKGDAIASIIITIINIIGRFKLLGWLSTEMTMGQACPDWINYFDSGRWTGNSYSSPAYFYGYPVLWLPAAQHKWVWEQNYFSSCSVIPAPLPLRRGY